ncbi:Sodium/hydrogen exchanger [Polychaeton citri CBS 116435]|uniref:Sodium/hydrogen exchanger n=1 Tax=Polychaeton citri CBS 116435 TaxID=1314669 RepID=A0A9P4Q2P9_9PEZI|nr:Sodium/hydrogen exchanger [Polychaeton citri CBS 116435]
MASTRSAALSYHEPRIVTILILTSFLLFLNVINYVFDRLVYCGLLGQILVGVWFGAPGTDWLNDQVQVVAQQLGYLGLILIVYEGRGLNTNLKTLKANLLLSSAVAVTGIGAPIGLSFILQSFLNISSLQAFAAGAALCSTSLGTTFTILTTSGLTGSRLGVVLTSAAMMDDVVGLVMVQVISSLGQASSKFSAVTIIRPVFVSIAFAVIVPAVCAWVIAPVTKRLAGVSKSIQDGNTLHRYLGTKQARFIMHTLFLIGMVAGSTYAGTSNLFAAYLAGAVISWYDSLLGSLGDVANDGSNNASASASANDVNSASVDESEGPAVRQSALNRSPDSETSRHIKPGESQAEKQPCVPSETYRRVNDGTSGMVIYEAYYQTPVETVLKPFFFASIGFSIPITQMFSGGIVWRGFVYAAIAAFGKLICGLWLVRLPTLRLPTSPIAKLARPLSLYPAAMLGSAMVARGEIGFLISSVAESSGVFSNSQGGSNLFLVVTWAIFLCTFIGPVAVGLLVRRVKRLQDADGSSRSGRPDPLGVWGISGMAT